MLPPCLSFCILRFHNAYSDFTMPSPCRETLETATTAEQQMLRTTRDLSVYFACKSDREHGRVLSALSDFRPLVETCLKKATEASPTRHQGAATEQTGAAAGKTQAKPDARKALGARNVNVNGSAAPQMMEGLGAAVAARAASRRAALAALP